MEPIAGGSRSEFISLTKNELVRILQSCQARNFTDKCNHLLSQIKQVIGCVDQDLSPETKRTLAHFTSDYKKKWEAASRNAEVFSKRNSAWLHVEIEFPLVTPKAVSTGRPSGHFSEVSERSKRRKTSELRSNFSPEELTYAAQMQLRSQGKLDSANVMKEILFSSPNRAKNYKKAYSDSIGLVVTPYSSDKALSLCVEAKLTKFQYNILRSSAKQNSCTLYPSYEAITAAKKRCYPEDIVITESTAEVKLQSLLNHTTLRLFESLAEIVDNLNSDLIRNLHLIVKWGCDGSSGLSLYKQRFEDSTVSDESMFLTSLVPLQLVSGEPKSKEKIVIWQNPRSSSPRFCRPIRCQFVHETTDITVKEKEHIDMQIAELSPTTIVHRNQGQQRDIVVTHDLVFTMIDGKVCNSVLENSSTQRCYLCGLTSKNFNDIDLNLTREIGDKTKLQFGLSSLHAWIRFFECLLHVSYKLVICQWQARGDENKRKVAQNKKEIQEKFRSRMGLLVDKPKPGYGSTNDGNTARRFFEDAAISSQITNLDEEIINRFRVVLLTISSGFPLKISEFKKYCIDTARRFVQLYPWYCMPTTVHKILIHSAEIVEHAILPIGQLGEEAQEARNKDIKRYREGFSRKFSRKQNMEDVFHMLLVSSDPLISNMRKLSPKKMKNYPSEVLGFFDQPSISSIVSEDLEDIDLDVDFDSE